MDEERWTIWVCDAPGGGVGMCACEGEWVERKGERVWVDDCKAEREIEVVPLEKLRTKSFAVRKCRVWHLGFLIAMQWEPRLGNGHGEHTQTLWPRRWTFAWTGGWDWSRP